MVKQVVIQLQDFNNEISEVPLPVSNQTSFGQMPVIQVNNNLKLNDYKLTNEIARQAFINFVSKNCCLNKSYSKHLKILTIDYQFVHKYTLTSFTEKRQTCFDYDQYTREIENKIDQIPDIWEIKSQYDPIPFVDNTETLMVPNSEIVKLCNRCTGTMKRTCPGCLGIQRENQDQKRCQICSGSFTVKCEVCKNGKLKWFQQLKITWKNYTETYYTKSEIPETKLRLIEGNLIYEDTGVRVNPINYVENEDINIACEKFTTKHEENYLKKEKLLHQRHEISIITVACIHYEYGPKKLGKFYIYYDKLDNLKVYSSKYSKNCCVGFLGCPIC